MVFGGGGADLTLAGQLAIGGTALVSSTGSTFLLHTLTKPYAVKLVEITEGGREAVEKLSLLVNPPSSTSTKKDDDEDDHAPPAQIVDQAELMRIHGQRKFMATTYKVNAMPEVTTFCVKDTEPVLVAKHPFATFKDKLTGKMYYLYGKDFPDRSLYHCVSGSREREKLEREAQDMVNARGL